MNNLKRVILAFLALVALMLTVSSASAYSSFPGSYYPGNQYGHEYVFYHGPWGESHVYGAYGYYPNYNGYAPYGYRTYGSMYSPWQMRWGTTTSGPVYRDPSTVWIHR